MRIAGLFVEGKLDSQLLGAVFGLPIVGFAGKHALPNAVRYAERHRTEPLTGRLAYVRDRDFDADPPDAPSRPVRVQHGDGILGWTWCRHEIENYLLEPEIVASALGCDADEYAGELATAASSVVAYAAARWTVGHIRAGLPRSYAFAPKPDDLIDNDFALPADLSTVACVSWLHAHTAAFRDRVCAPLDDAALEPKFQSYRMRLAGALARAEDVIVWFPGKDLMAALAPWLATRALEPHRFRERLRDWFVEHPEQALTILPEWRRLRDALRGETEGGAGKGTESDT